MLKLKKLDLLTKNDEIHNKSEHRYCDHWHDKKIDVFSQVQECRSNK
jgi:hypothetical protein